MQLFKVVREKNGGDRQNMGGVADKPVKPVEKPALAVCRSAAEKRTDRLRKHH